MSVKNKRILISAAVIAALLIVAAIVIGVNQKSMASYMASISEADSLMEDGDYSSAILKYYEAIQEKPEKEDGYLGIALAYHKAGRDDYAVKFLLAGLEYMPGNERLLALYEEYGGKSMLLAVMFDSDQLDSIAGMTYYDYGKKGSIESIKAGNSNSYKVRVKGIAADLIYRNTSEQPNAVGNRNPNPESTPAEVRYDNIMSLFGGASSMSYADLKGLGVKELQLINDQEFGAAVSFQYDLYKFVIQSDKNGNISAGAGNVIYMPGSLKGSGDVSVSGSVLDAVNGDGVSSAELVFSGKGGKTETVTGKNGSYSVSLGHGEYTVEISASGYISETKSIYVPSNAESWSCDLVISPEMSANEARIVLTWGSHPADLDSHLVGNGVHVYFGDQESAVADLDIDDRDGYGPETTTIHDLSGNYTFVVHDFEETGDIGSSGATVTVYLPGKSPQTIEISGGGSDTWVVFTLKNGDLNIINDVRHYDLGIDFDD